MLANVKLKFKVIEAPTTVNKVNIEKLSDDGIKGKYDESIEQKWKTILTQQPGVVEEEWNKIKTLYRKHPEKY